MDSPTNAAVKKTAKFILDYSNLRPYGKLNRLTTEAILEDTYSAWFEEEDPDAVVDTVVLWWRFDQSDDPYAVDQAVDLSQRIYEAIEKLQDSDFTYAQNRGTNEIEGISFW